MDMMDFEQVGAGSEKILPEVFLSGQCHQQSFAMLLLVVLGMFVNLNIQ